MFISVYMILAAIFLGIIGLGVIFTLGLALMLPDYFDENTVCITKKKHHKLLKDIEHYKKLSRKFEFLTNPKQ